MKITIGKIFKWGGESVIGLEIPGIGILESKKFETKIDDFSFVELNHKQLIELRKQIDKEVGEKNEEKEASL
jgi:hypothetical protein